MTVTRQAGAFPRQPHAATPVAPDATSGVRPEPIPVSRPRQLRTWEGSLGGYSPEFPLINDDDSPIQLLTCSDVQRYYTLTLPHIAAAGGPLRGLRRVARRRLDAVNPR